MKAIYGHAYMRIQRVQLSIHHGQKYAKTKSYCNNCILSQGKSVMHWAKHVFLTYFFLCIEGKLLQATDRQKVPFLDILIECDQKTVVSNAAVS